MSSDTSPGDVSDRRLGLLFVGAPRVPEMVRLAGRAEENGFESVWMAETRMTRDGFVPLAAIASATDQIGLATGIVNVYTRGPVVLAVSFASLAELAPGRVTVGLGAGSPLVLAPQGVAWERPVTRLREYVDVLRPLLRGEEVSYDGEAVHLTGARIEDALGEGGIGAGSELPLYLGVTGRRAVELAGATADGVLLNIGLPTSYVGRALGWLAAGAALAGRDSADIDVSMVVLVSPDEDSAQGKARALRFVALYLSLFPNIARETSPSSYVDVAGSKMLLQVSNQLQKKGIKLKIVEALSNVREILRKQGMEEMIGRISRRVFINDVVQEFITGKGDGCVPELVSG